MTTFLLIFKKGSIVSRKNYTRVHADAMQITSIGRMKINIFAYCKVRNIKAVYKWGMSTSQTIWGYGTCPKILGQIWALHGPMETDTDCFPRLVDIYSKHGDADTWQLAMP